MSTVLTGTELVKVWRNITIVHSKLLLRRKTNITVIRIYTSNYTESYEQYNLFYLTGILGFSGRMCLLIPPSTSNRIHKRAFIKVKVM